MKGTIRTAARALAALALWGCAAGSASAEDFFYAPGRWAYDQGQYQKARDIFQGELDKSPNDAAAAYGLGNSLYQLGQYADAAQAYQKALQAAPRMEPGWYNLGNSLYRQKNYQGAVGAYQKALALDPKDGDAARNLKLAQSKIPPSPTPTPGTAGQKQGPGKKGAGGKKSGSSNGSSGQGQKSEGGQASGQRPSATPGAQAGAPAASPTPDADARRQAQARRELGMSDAQVQKLLEQAQRQERQNQGYFSLDPKLDQQQRDSIWGMMPQEQRDLMRRLFGTVPDDQKQPEEDW